MGYYNPKQFRGAICAAERLIKYGRTDGASITTLFFAAGEFPPAEIYSDQDALHELTPSEVLRITKKIGGEFFGGSNPGMPN